MSSAYCGKQKTLLVGQLGPGADQVEQFLVKQRPVALSQAADFGVDLDEHIEFCAAAMNSISDQLFD